MADDIIMNLPLLLTRLDKLAQVLLATDLRRALVRHRVMAGAEHRQILSRDLATAVDIGANRGQFSLAAREWSPGARMIAFEPLPGPGAVFPEGLCRGRDAVPSPGSDRGQGRGGDHSCHRSG